MSVSQAAVHTPTLTVKPASASSRPRILFVSHVADIKGGAERVLLGLLANPLLDPVLAVPEPGELSEAAAGLNIPFACYHPRALLAVRRPPSPGKMAAAGLDVLRCAARIRRLARTHGCELVHTNGLKAHAIGGVARALLGPPVVMHFHDIPYSAVERQIWWVLGAFARRIIVVSAPCWPGRVGGKVQVVVNAVAPCRPALTDPPPLRTLRLGFIGRYHVHKGMDLLLNWTAAARQAGIDFSLVLRGRPDPDYLPYWARIQGRIRAEGLADCVVDQGWRSSTAVYDDLDIVVVPSQMPDPAPLVIPEAMGAGVVVVAYPSGGIPGLVPAGTGALVEHPAAFAKALHDFLTVPDLYRRTREAAYAHVRIAHDPDAVARHFAQVCVSALSPSPKVQA